jgi:hypothetical protein
MLSPRRISSNPSPHQFERQHMRDQVVDVGATYARKAVMRRTETLENGQQLARSAIFFPP